MVTLPTDTEILITREFDAPKHLVYRAYTEPELVRRWWPGKRGEMTVAEIDLRVGGTYRYVMIATGGFEVGFHGEYHEIVPDERIVHTEVFEGIAERRRRSGAEHHHVRGDRRAHDADDAHAGARASEIRDMIIDSGMEGGMQEGMDLLEEVAKSL